MWGGGSGKRVRQLRPSLHPQPLSPKVPRLSGPWGEGGQEKGLGGPPPPSSWISPLPHLAPLLALGLCPSPFGVPYFFLAHSVNFVARFSPQKQHRQGSGRTLSSRRLSAHKFQKNNVLPEERVSFEVIEVQHRVNSKKNQPSGKMSPMCPDALFLASFPKIFFYMTK